MFGGNLFIPEPSLTVRVAKIVFAKIVFGSGLMAVRWAESEIDDVGGHGLFAAVVVHKTQEGEGFARCIGIGAHRDAATSGSSACGQSWTPCRAASLVIPLHHPGIAGFLLHGLETLFHAFEARPVGRVGGKVDRFGGVAFQVEEFEGRALDVGADGAPAIRRVLAFPELRLPGGGGPEVGGEGDVQAGFNGSADFSANSGWHASIHCGVLWAPPRVFR